MNFLLFFPIDVHVVKLTGIKIKTPVVRMRVGSEIPLSAVGLDENNQDAFSFGSALPNLMMSWSLSNQNVAKVSWKFIFKKSEIIKNFLFEKISMEFFFFFFKNLF